LATDPEAWIRFPTLPEKKVMGLERGPISLVSANEELLDRKVAAPIQKTENTAVGIRHADHVAPSIRKIGNRIANKRRSLGRYSSLADSDHGVKLISYYQVNYSLRISVLNVSFNIEKEKVLYINKLVL
jgi:hypothetical protein